MPACKYTRLSFCTYKSAADDTNEPRLTGGRYSRTNLGKARTRTSKHSGLQQEIVDVVVSDITRTL